MPLQRLVLYKLCDLRLFVDEVRGTSLLRHSLIWGNIDNDFNESFIIDKYLYILHLLNHNENTLFL